jgi:hypothetical protein
MRRHARLLVTLAIGCCTCAFAPRAGAAIQAFIQQVPISAAAIANDPTLATMQCFDFMATTDGNWASAGVRLTLPSGAFYNNPFGGNTRPNPSLLPVFPALEFDTYVTAPGDTGTGGAPAILGGFPEGDPVSFGPTVFSVSWGDLANDPPGTYRIARVTFPQNTFPALHPLSRTSQVNPDSTALFIPEPTLGLSAAAAMLVVTSRVRARRR